MENATKALLIAAAILIAIVLISVGVYVLRQGQDAMSSVDLSEAQILAFNSYFESYEGNQKGSQVKNLLNRIISSNNKNSSDTSMQVTVYNGAMGESGATPVASEGIKNFIKGIKTTAWYSVEFDRSEVTSLIISAYIKQL